MKKAITHAGDDGTTSLLTSGRLSKADLHIEAIGTLDEANAMLGVIRSQMEHATWNQDLLHIQRDLYQLMAFVAATPDHGTVFPFDAAEKLKRLEEKVSLLGSVTPVVREFIVPGDSLLAAQIDVARTIVRKAERRVIQLFSSLNTENKPIFAYLNRLSTFLFDLELAVIHDSAAKKPTLARKLDK